MDTKRSAMLDALIAGGPAEDRAKDMALYGWLIGAWDVDVFDHHADGSVRHARGEWCFDWILEGRAIQDVFIVPRRTERSKDGAALGGDRCGTTLRVFDPRHAIWRIDWTNPITQARNRMVGRKVGSEIIQDALELDAGAAPYRWIFSEIALDSFRWRAEVSSDGGRRWQVTVEFRATRSLAPESLAPDRETT